MPKFNSQDHHQPRKSDKRKHHQRGFNEDIQTQRAGRVNFKNYLRQIREPELSDEDGFDDSQLDDQDE